MCHCSGITFADRGESWQFGLVDDSARDFCGGHGSIDSFLPFRFCVMSIHVPFDSQGTSYIRIWHEQIQAFLWNIDIDLSFTEKAAFIFSHFQNIPKRAVKFTSWNWNCTPVAGHRSFTGGFKV